MAFSRKFGLEIVHNGNVIYSGDRVLVYLSTEEYADLANALSGGLPYSDLNFSIADRYGVLRNTWSELYGNRNAETEFDRWRGYLPHIQKQGFLFPDPSQADSDRIAGALHIYDFNCTINLRSSNQTLSVPGLITQKYIYSSSTGDGLFYEWTGYVDAGALLNSLCFVGTSSYGSVSMTGGYFYAEIPIVVLRNETTIERACGLRLSPSTISAVWSNYSYGPFILDGIPFIPPEEQDTPYFPENPTNPSQQPTEPQVGPTPGEWILHEDYIPRLPSPNNDLGLGIMRVYSMDSSQLQAFGTALWSTNVLTAMKTMISNPLDVVISLMSFPFELRNYSAAENIKFAWLSQWVEGSCNGNPLTSEIEVINFGQIEVKRYSGTFYDYEPYSSAALYLPYIGFVALKTNEILGKTLRLQYFVNLISGNFTAVVDVDGNPQIIGEFQGVMGRPLPLSSGDFFRVVQKTAELAAGAAAMAVGGLAAGAAAAGVLEETAGAGAAKFGFNQMVGDAVETLSGTGQTAGGYIQSAAGMGAKMAKDNMNAMQSVVSGAGHIQRTGSIGAVSGRTSTQEAFLLLTIPHQSVPENQALLGYPTNLPGPLSNYKGHTQVRVIELSAPGASEGELAEIHEILSAGIDILE